MKKNFQFLALFSIIILLISCNKHTTAVVIPTPVAYDSDAQKFYDASGISDTTQKTAINNLVKELKDSSLWTRFIAIYPMVGGSASTTKWNLKDPRDLDTAYRLTFYGSPVYASTGVLFPSVIDYADTHLPDSAIGGYNNAAISFFSRTQNTISGYDMGCTDGASPYNELSVYAAEGDDIEWFGFNDNSDSLNTTGLFILSSTPTNVVRYHNGISVHSKGTPPNNQHTNLTFLIGKSRVTQHPGQKECALATMGNSLSDSQALTFYNIVKHFENFLNR